MHNYEIEGTTLVSYDGDEAEFIIPDEVEELGERAFSDASSLKKITISSKVKNIQATAFYDYLGHIELEKIVSVDDNPFFTSKDGVLYSKDMTKLIVYPTASTVARFEVPETVRTIGEKAFYGCNHLKEIMLPEECVTIETEAFADCWNLQKINLDYVKTIGDCAFESCGLRKVELFSVKKFEGTPFLGTDLNEIFIYKGIETKVSGNSYSYDVFVLSKENHSLVGVFPIHHDGNSHTDNMLKQAWDGKDSFDYQLLDDYFKSIKKPIAKTKVALTRLLYPFELNKDSKKNYQAHIKRNAVNIVEKLIDGPADKSDDYSPYLYEQSFEICDSLELLKKGNIDELINYASRSDNMQWSAFLLDWKNKNVKPKTDSIDLSVPDLLVGDEIVLGQYPRDGKDVPIEWIVIDSTKNQYLIISKYLIKEMTFFSGTLKKDEFIGWSHSDVRKWLNGEFYMSAFDEAERARICLKKHKNSRNDDTEDHIFIPSETEFNKYVGGPHLRQKNISFSHGSQAGQGEEEMLRTTRMYYSECHVKTMSNMKSTIVDTMLFRNWTRRLNESYYIRPMMWISK